MNLNVQDISQYIVLIIFVLIILKVIGPGISASIIEMITGKKNSDEFDLDGMIQNKKHQFTRELQSTAMASGKRPLLIRLKESSLKDKEQLEKLLGSLQWGAVEKDFCLTSVDLLENIDNSQGLTNFMTPLLEKSFDENSEDLLSIWKELYDKSTLWLNLVNTAKSNNKFMGIDSLISKKSLGLFLEDSITDINQKSQSELDRIPELLSFAEKVMQLNIFDLNTADIFNKWNKNSLIFKSLAPIVPISIENTKQWAQEVLEISDDTEDADLIKSQYKKLVSSNHPDKFNSLNLSSEEKAILNANLALINKAYEILSK